ncbi:MAG: right-handed parallel beta-helix repeat-containing protein [Chthoniobacter sp.]|uniref:right-handed parallel beta-helix repeat-containing protein n=1 Tax=Chthoniobacter sp. TaxID=2510640 RepID=UPI0032A6AE22
MNEDAPNVFEIRTGCERITIEGLTIDGGRTANDPNVGTHAQRCGIIAIGPYNYTDGPTGKPVEHLVVRDCVIHNCFGRGVAFYAVHDGLVANCTIEDTCEEAVDLDHFTVAARVLNNQIARCRVGVELNDANECWVTGNCFAACEIGVNVWRWCKMGDLNVRNHIVDNLVLNTVGNGLQLDAGTQGNIVRGNIVRSSGRNGITLGGTETTISENVIEHSGLNGIALGGNRNEITRNQISDSGVGAKQKFAGLRIRGAQNRILDNLVLIGFGADAPVEPVADEGEANTIRTP